MQPDPVTIGAFVTGTIIVSTADYKRGQFPPPAKTIVALGIVYLIIGAITIKDSRLSRMLAIAVLVGIVIKDLPVVVGSGKSVSDSSVPLAPDAAPGTTPTDISSGGYPGTGNDHAGDTSGSSSTQKTGKGTHSQ
jgi:hypothetical protein